MTFLVVEGFVADLDVAACRAAKAEPAKLNATKNVITALICGNLCARMFSYWTEF